MKLTATLLVIAGLVMPSIVFIWGAKMANAPVPSCTFGEFVIQAPCWLINSLAIAVSSAFILDIILFVILPKLTNKSLSQTASPNIVPDSFEEEVVKTFIHKGTSTREVTLHRAIIQVTSDDMFNSPAFDSPKAKIKFESKPGKEYMRFYIQLRNVKKEGVNLTDSEPLHAKLEYFDSNLNKILKHEQPYWQNRERGHQPILRKNGRAENLCLAIQEVGKNKSDLYAFAYNMSYPHNSLEPINEKLLICKVNDIVYIKITLYGGNIGERFPVWWFKVKNDEIDGFLPDYIDDPLKGE